MNPAVAVKRLWSQPEMLNIEWADGTLSEFASLWLRDNLPEDRDAHSGQRLIDIADLPENPRIRSAIARNGAVDIEVEAELAARRSNWDGCWRTRRIAQLIRRNSQPNSGSREPLDAARRMGNARSAHRARRAGWLRRLLQDGIAFLSQVPSVDAGILEAAALVGRVSETNYGLVYDALRYPNLEICVFGSRLGCTPTTRTASRCLVFKCCMR